VIHTHSPHLLAFALAGRPLPVRYEPLPRLGQAEEVPVAPSASAVIELIGARPGTQQAVLLRGHGVLAFGPDAETTFSLLVALEEAVEAELHTAVLGRLSAPPGTLHILFLGYAKVGSRSDLEAAGRLAARHHGRGHPALVGTLTGPAGPAGSAAGPLFTMVRGWTSAFAS